MAGTELGETLDRMLDDPTPAYVHVHIAEPGCFAAKAVRPN